MNSAVSVKTSLLIPIEDLAKTRVCISNFNILIVTSQKTIKSDIKNTTSEANPNSLNIKSTASDSDINISIKKPKRKLKNAKPKLVKK